jgi:hypothetical protein
MWKLPTEAEQAAGQTLCQLTADAAVLALVQIS